MRALTRIRKFFRNERGNVLVIGAATMPLMIGAAAVGIDTIQLSLWKRQLQRMADSAALAGAHAVMVEQDADAAVTRDLGINNILSPVTSDSQNAPEAGAFKDDASAVRVVLNTTRTLPFWQMFLGSSPTVAVEATAKVVEDGHFCLLTLEDTEAPGIEITGNSDLNLGCGIATNSKAAQAITATGSAELVASPVMAVGGLDTDNDKFDQSVMLPYSGKQKDPFAHLPDPSDLISGMDCTDEFDPATYAARTDNCFSKMNISSAFTFDAGTYYIVGDPAVKGSGLANFGSGADVKGYEVTIVFTGEGDSIGKFDMDGQAKLELKAPKPGATSEPYPGVVFYRDGDRDTMDTLKINGGQELKIEGAMYFPKTRLWFNGNSAVTSNCLQIVAQQAEFKGGTDFKNDCKDGYGKMLTAKFVRLVG